MSAEAQFRDLIVRYRPALRRLCAAYLWEPADRDDLFQEIAAAVWTALPRFRGDASERTWLYRIAHNVAMTYATRRRRQHQREHPLEEATQRAANTVDPRRADLLRLVEQLEPIDRQIALLYLEGLTASETEDVLGLNPNHAAVRLTRLRRKLMAAVRPREVHP